MVNFVAATAALAIGIGAFAPAAMADTANNYNLFVLNNMNAMYSDTQGRVAVGGNANLVGYAVGQTAQAGQTNLVVGGNLTTQGGSTKGGIVAGGSTSFTWYDSSGNQPGASVPVDFGAEAIRLGVLTDTLAGYTANGTTSYYDGHWSHGWQTTMTGTNTDLNIFTLDGAMASKSNTFTINITPGSTALINVTGDIGLIYQAGFTINGGNASNILWNFSDATSLSFYDVGMMGSVLAPNAAYDPSGWGSINGQLIVKSFLGDGGGVTQVNSSYFAGNLLNPAPPVASLPPPTAPTAAIPEPATWALMIGGFGLMGVMLRRRRATTQLV